MKPDRRENVAYSLPFFSIHTPERVSNAAGANSGALASPSSLVWGLASLVRVVDRERKLVLPGEMAHLH